MRSMAFDLDGADVGEVRRRVAEPVVRALIAPNELDLLEVRFGAPTSYRVDEGDAPEVWVYVTARGEHFARRLTKATFDRWDAWSVADFLIDEIVESRFGWGQLRDVDLAAVVLPPRWPTDVGGRAMLEVYPDENDPSPLWRAGANVALDDLPLSSALAGELLRWRNRWAELAEAAEAAEATDDDLSGTYAQMVAELEPDRRQLVAALRAELNGAGVEVADPIALDELPDRG
jgi:hypothetical protein